MYHFVLMMWRGIVPILQRFCDVGSKHCFSLCLTACPWPCNSHATFIIYYSFITLVCLKTPSVLLLILLHPFDSLFSWTTWVSWHQEGKPFWILVKQEMMGWQWHEVDHMLIIFTSLQTDNHASTSPVSFYRPDALPATQPTASKH